MRKQGKPFQLLRLRNLTLIQDWINPLLNNRARQDNCQQFLSIAEPCGYDFIAWLSAAANGKDEYQRLSPYSVQTFMALYITNNSLVFMCLLEFSSRQSLSWRTSVFTNNCKLSEFIINRVNMIISVRHFHLTVSSTYLPRLAGLCYQSAKKKNNSEKNWALNPLLITEENFQLRSCFHHRVNN